MTQPGEQSANVPTTEAPASELSTLYQKLIDAAEVAQSADPVESGVATGFVDLDPELNSDRRLTPAGNLPGFLNSDKPDNVARLNILPGDRVLIWLRDAGGLNRWERRAQAGTTQSVTAVFNGRHEMEIPFQYDGETGWQLLEVALPAGLTAAELFCCEIEKSGQLIFSDLVDDTTEMLDADVMTPVRFVRPGILEGWANSDSALGKDVLFQVLIEGRPPEKIRTAGQWDGPQLRRFNLRTGIEPNALCMLRLESISGKKAARDPIWVCHNDHTGILMGNPRRADNDHILLTLVGAPGEEHQPRILIDPDNREVDRYPVDIEDKPPFLFRFRGKTNTVLLPRSRIESGVRFLMENGEGVLIGPLPSLKPVLDHLS